MASQKDKYSVILPTYEERKNLPIIVKLIFDMADKNNFDFEIVVVDDGSPDGTGDVCRQLQKIFPNKIQLHERPKKMGLGSAYQAGLKFCNGNFVVLMDADMSHHPKFLVDFIKKQKETDADIVQGTRYKPGGGVFGWDLKRKLTSRVANFIAKTALGQGSSDLTGSFRLYKKPIIEKIMYEVISKGYAFQMEIIMRAISYNYKIEEIPIIFVDRIFGESKLGANEITIYLKGIWKLMWTL